MKAVGPDQTYIDYFQGVYASQQGASNLFGLRVREDSFIAVVKNGDGPPNAWGKEFRIPVQLEMLPSHVRMIVDDHVLNYPASDLIDVLTGKQSFPEALESLRKVNLRKGPKSAQNSFQTLRNKFAKGARD